MRAFRPWLRALLGAAVLVLLARTLGAEAFVRGVAEIDAAALLAALGIGMATTIATAWRWAVVARGLGLRLGLPRAVADYYRALLLNAVLPAGVLGDVHRAFAHRRRAAADGCAAAGGRAVRAVVLERAAGQTVLISSAILVLAARPELVTATGRLFPSPSAAAATGAGVVVLGGAAALWLLGSHSGRRRRARARAWAAEARSAVLARGRWAAVGALSAAGLAGHLALFVVAARVADVEAPTADLLPPMLVALLAMSVPVGVGGWGPRESAAALGFAAVGLGAEAGLGTAVVYGVLALVSSLPGALVLWPLRRAARRPGAPSGGRVAAADRTTSVSEEQPATDMPPPPQGQIRRMRASQAAWSTVAPGSTPTSAASSSPRTTQR
ncbi:lysylphosphatidylglycerol synthase transmembrane domain-containing protein [Streptomonospora litoralis]|uniref:Dolichol-P-glucose synthetase-like protein n=1 Tax=Streptomonospora litoralis TaxID=2498135 RepID=A0A4P6Q6Z5_9ACTN|nr:lysylphosphatidylglycerol synthase domain-containing protein [Streptomonospora litoralis]QBI56558.1 hypothetical protein EKD16_24065 [Streptomonospora litoralis]